MDSTTIAVISYFDGLGNTNALPTDPKSGATVPGVHSSVSVWVAERKAGGWMCVCVGLYHGHCGCPPDVVGHEAEEQELVQGILAILGGVSIPVRHSRSDSSEWGHVI